MARKRIKKTPEDAQDTYLIRMVLYTILGLIAMGIVAISLLALQYQPPPLGNAPFSLPSERR